MIRKRKFSESMLVRVLENAPAIIAFHDKENNILWANKAYCEAAGRNLDQVIGMKCWVAWGLEKPCRDCPVTVAMETGKAAKAEMTPEIQPHWPKTQGNWLVKAVPLRDERGELIGVIETAFEISQRIAEDQSRHVEEKIKLLSALNNTAIKLSESLSPSDKAKEVVHTAGEVFGLTLAWLGYAEKDGTVRLLAHYPEEISYPLDITVRSDETPEGQGPAGRAIRSGLPQIVQDVSTDQRFIPWREKALKIGIRSVAAFPLITRDTTFGTLNLYSDQKDYFSPERVEYLQLFAHLAASALEGARLYEETKQRLERITALRQIDLAISGSLDLRVVYSVALDEIVKNLQVDAAAILRMNPSTQVLELVAKRGFRTNKIEVFKVPIGEGTAGRIVVEGEIVHIPDISRVDSKELTRRDVLVEEGFVSYYGTPIVAKGQFLGILEVYHRSIHEHNGEWRDFLRTLAGQVAIAIENAGLVDDLRHHHTDLLKAYDETLEGWARFLALKEEETEEHSQRVTQMTIELARRMGIREEELIHVRRGALLHDIGKIGIPDSILLKPGKLTEEEWEVMRKHPVYAFEMLAPIAYLSRAIDIPYCHHEKWDGTGYPRGLKGKQIPLAARIFAVVDVWDALSSDRPYRKAWPKEKVFEYIKENSGTHFDPEVVECFIKIINENAEES